MERRRCVFGLKVAFVAALSLTAFLLGSTQLQHGPFTSKLKSTILGILQLGGPSSLPSVDMNQQPSGADTYRPNGALSPNLSSCHQSFGRKDFLVDCCPLANYDPSTPVFDFSPPPTSASPLRVRRSTYSLDPDFIAKYEKAISIMKTLPYSDPRNFMRQANLHCQSCTGAYDEQGSPGVPLNIHGSWLFFPWHRMVLYFHERILGSLIGDPTFALPYWPWDVPEAMSLPEMFLNGSFYDPERDVSHLPPATVDLDYATSVERGLSPEEQIDLNLKLMYNQMVSGAKKAELFMGCVYKAGEGGSCHRAGTMELAPHDTVHTWVGSNLNPGRENMGKFYSAARDPSFYPHHANIDRLWEVWRKINGIDVGFADPDWLNTHFYFYDWDLKLVKISVGDVLSMTNLGYAYEDVDVPWLKARPKPSMPPRLARHRLRIHGNKQRKLKSLSSLALGAGGKLSDSAMITVEVPRPKINRTRADKAAKEEVLVVYGIDLEHEEDTRFDVYINLADQSKADPRFREFVGTFVHISNGLRSRTRKEKTLKLGISEALEDLEADGDNSIWVSLVPRSKSCVNVTFEGVRVEYMG